MAVRRTARNVKIGDVIKLPAQVVRVTDKKVLSDLIATPTTKQFAFGGVSVNGPWKGKEGNFALLHDEKIEVVSSLNILQKLRAWWRKNFAVKAKVYDGYARGFTNK